MRTSYNSHQFHSYLKAKSSSQKGFSQSGFLLGLFLVVGIAVFLAFHTVSHHVSASTNGIKSGFSGYCLDAYHGQTISGTPVDIYTCNDTKAQVFAVNYDSISYSDKLCLNVAGNATANGSKVDLSTCDQSPGQVWLKDSGGYINPNSDMCLATKDNQQSGQLELNSCANLSNLGEQWSAVNDSNSCFGSQGEKVACYATKEWASWNSGAANHNNLLNTYTDGAPYEEWCADFVSYVYKEAGYPFTSGEANGWDESNANNIQNQGFSIKDPSTYTPKPGDIGFFSYSGGHVEIVVSGGVHPTFIYGDSGHTDPTTNNGDMATNTLTSYGSEGQLLYYLTPN